MKKVLIITYFFPPSNFAGSYRISSWAKHFNKCGYFPIIITRNWNPNQTDLTDKVLNNEYNCIKTDGFELHSLPYNRNLRDKIHRLKSSFLTRNLSKFLSYIELIFQNFLTLVIPYKNLYHFADEYLENNNDINYLIVSGRPFQLFKFGFDLNKKHGIKWIADYRDEWCSSNWGQSRSGILNRFLFGLEKRSEIKWTKSCSFFVSCSEDMILNINKLINKNGYLVLNGFDEDDYYFSNNNSIESKYFEIIYNGTLYKSQPIESFLSVFKKVIDNYKHKTQIKLVFLGLDIDLTQKNRVLINLTGYEKYVEFFPRIPKAEAIQKQKFSDILLMLSHCDIKGTYSSKIFEYLAIQKPILVFPNDKSVLENLITQTKAGFVSDTEELAYEFITKLIDEKIQSGIINFKSDLESIKQYSRFNQVKKFSDYLRSFEIKK